MMQNRFFHWLVYTRLTMGLQAAGIALTAMLFFGLSISIFLLLVICTYSSAIYYFNRDEEDTINDPEKVKFLKNTRFLNYLYPALFALVVAATAIYNVYAALVIILFLALGLVYNTTWIPKKLARRIGAKRVKEIPYLKSLFISASWGLFVVVVAVYYNMPFTLIVPLVYSFVFLRFFINTVVYDMKDVKGDKKAGVRTIPVIFGIRRASAVLMLLNLIAAAYLFACAYYGFLPPLAHFINLITIYVFYYLLKARQEGTDMRRLCYTYADGEFILWGLLALAGAYASGFPVTFGFI
jgi:4-hydroxybenzoate polyprenyltransferase